MKRRRRCSKLGGRRRSFAAILLPLIFAPLALSSCIFTRGGGAATIDPTAEAVLSPADSAAALASPDTSVAVEPARTVARPAPARPPEAPAPTKEPQGDAPSFSVGLSEEESARLRDEAVRELAEAGLLLSRLNEKPLAPEKREMVRTAEDLLRSGREAYERNDLAAAVALAKKARLLAAEVSESIKRRE